MKQNSKLIKNLNAIFRSEKFIRSLMQEENSFSDYIYSKMGRVLEYYIITRDENINYTYEDIEKKLSQIDYEQFKENIIDNGFMTHSFNGNKKDKIEKYGLDYVTKMNDEELKQHKEMRKSLNELEKLLGTSEYVKNLERNKDNSYNQSIFVCSPGAKTFHYACSRSPERLYEGPLKGFEKEPMIVGETKENYLMRVLEKKINAKYPQNNSKDREYAIQVAKKVIDSYCSFSPSFAMLSLAEIKDIQSGMTEYENKGTESLISRINRAIMSDYRNIFSTVPSDALETNNLGDLAIISTEIPKNAISIVQCMDEFEMQQIFARMQGLKEGEFIDYTSDKEKGKPKIAELVTVMDFSKNVEELNNTYNIYKKEVLEELEQKKGKLEAKYGTISIQDLKEKILNEKRELLSRKKEILDREYLKKEGISLEYGLKDILEELESKNLKEHLLETDKNIKEDSLQYQSELHGISHTRRVNFFATIIMNSENIDEQTKKIIENIVKNHDIGRTNDIEDKEHGRKSVDLLENNIDRINQLNDEQKEIVRFIIKEHSLSARENANDLNEMFDTKIQECFDERMMKIQPWMKKEGTEQKLRNDIAKRFEGKKIYVQKILDICKDADKLDRVRLDQLGIDLREGLDTSRLSLASSKKFENLAYESFDKILEILDIEHELSDINKQMYEIDEMITLETEVSQFQYFEERMSIAKLKEDSKKKDFLNNMISDRRLSKISEIPKKIKNLFLLKNKEQER